eukprot:8797496-Alexandrium_andersonii.AAC.1
MAQVPGQLHAAGNPDARTSANRLFQDFPVQRRALRLREQLRAERPVRAPGPPGPSGLRQIAQLRPGWAPARGARGFNGSPKLILPAPA